MLTIKPSSIQLFTKRKAGTSAGRRFLGLNRCIVSTKDSTRVVLHFGGTISGPNYAEALQDIEVNASHFYVVGVLIYVIRLSLITCVTYIEVNASHFTQLVC